MEYDGINNIICDAEENDWLDVSYSERKYVTKPIKKGRKKLNFNFKFTKKMRIAAIAVCCVAALAALLFIDGNFSKEVFNTVKAATASVFTREPAQVSANIAIPVNVTLIDVKDGVATFNGGKATLSFTDGKVTDITDNSVTIQIDDKTTITYDNLQTVFVAVGDSVSVNSLLAKYDKQFTATINIGGETVKDVIASESQLTWNV